MKAMALRVERPLLYLLLVAMLAPALIAILPRDVAAQVPPDVVADPADQVIAPETYSDRVRSGQVTTVSEFRISLAAGEQLTVETANISEGGDPVLHLLEARSGEQIRVDDNGAGGTAARVSFTAGAEVDLLVVARARTQETAGTADLLKNGEAWKTGVTFAGWHNYYGNLTSGERLQTVHQPGGSGAFHRLYVIDRRDELSITMRAAGGGPNGAAILNVDRRLDKHVVIAAVTKPEAAERALLIRNDIATDADQDGLGDSVEATLGTCSTLSGWVRVGDGYEFDCGLAADPRDTDGDGIRDGLEVFGLLVYDGPVVATGAAIPESNALAGPIAPDFALDYYDHLDLPMWGADPRHKDLFIEVDFMMRQPDETAQKLMPNVARQFASYYQDTVDNPIPLVDLYRAVSLRNPDGKRGINTHLDTGIAPEMPEDATIYGDWGGYNAVPPVQKEDGSWAGDSPHTAWQNHLGKGRRGIFRYILAYPSGGGQSPVNSFAAAGPMNNAWVLAHEFAHAMGLTHSGPPGATGAVDPNCKPNYQSLLNYAFQSNPNVGFSDGSDLGALNYTASLNNAALREFEAVDPSNIAYMDVLENTFEYYVDRANGHVDWNRDGEIAAEGTTVRAYANYKPGGGGCEFTRYNQSTLADMASVTSPAMARLGNRLYVFSSTLGIVFYRHSTDAGNCPQADVTACATWSDRKSAYMDAQGGIDVVKLGDDALLVVTIDHNGTLWERRLTVDADGNEHWTDHRQIAGQAAKSEPSLAGLGYCKTFLAYRGADGLVRYNRMSCADDFANWQGETLALDQDGNTLAMADFASPGIGRAYLNEPGLAQMYGAFANTNGWLDLYRFNEDTDRWEMTDLLETRPGPIEGRPALEWTSENVALDYPGKFYLMYIRHDGFSGRGFREQKRMVGMLTSYVKLEKQDDGQLSKTLKVGLHGPFDNVWYYAFGIDLFFEAGIDSNLKAVTSIAINKPEVWASIQFRPKADGIHDFTMTDYNDWEVLRDGLCRNVVNPGGLVSYPITCHGG